MNKQLEFVECDNGCGNQTNLLFVENGFHTVECKKCGLIYLNPRPRPETIFKRYASEKYFNAHQGRYEDWQENSEKKLKILQKVSHGKRMLEIGMAKGFFLKTAKEHGYTVSGIDISSYAVEYVKTQYGFEVFEKSIEKFETEMLYDVICFFDVLSHVISPTSFFNSIAKREDWWCYFLSNRK